jgi:cytochrome d ubiquinol oxidase subunit II
MVPLWYAIVALLLAAYVVLDGFDLGAGALHLWVARGDDERRRVLAAIGPFWDGNEVCLLAAGGALFAAFPAALAAGLSGFALAIFLVVWTLILRGIAIEFRSHVGDPLWRSAWDVVFCGASALLPVLLGAALGNLLRGVPLDAYGWFELPLFTDFTTAEPVGLLDGYTVLTGLFALVALVLHGAALLAWRATGTVEARARAAIRVAWPATALLWAAATWATARVNRPLFDHLRERPLAWLFAALALAGLLGTSLASRRGRHGLAFLSSSAFLAGLLAATASTLYPVLLRSVGDGSATLIASEASSPRAGLATATGWFALGLPLAVAWFVVNFRIHRPKAPLAPEGEGY